MDKEVQNGKGERSALTTVTVAAVQLWSSKERSPDDNRMHALEMLERAARKGPDLVVLPEAVSMLCYPDGRPDFSYHDIAEPVPGPTTDRMAAIAGRYHTNVVAGLVDGPLADGKCQNTAVVLDREGNLAGRYDKLHEPEVCRKEQAAGTGNQVPVFDMDFGRIGVLICWDLIAPELAALMVWKGARLLCFPHLIAFPGQLNSAVSLRARAVDNAVPVIAAGMRDDHNHNGSLEGLYPTCMIDAMGAIIRQSTVAGPDVIDARVVLNSPRVNYVGRNERDVDWQAQRRREARFDVYAAEYAALLENRKT